MYQIAAFLWICAYVDSASYQRYDNQYGSTPYPAYSTYSTIANLYEYPYKAGSRSDIASFPEVTRYPNYNPGLSTTGYNTYTTPRSNVFYPPGGSSDVYGGYGQGYSSYEMPFMKNFRDSCVNRSPQTGIWVDSLMGMWYGVEFIQHLAGDSRVDYARTCIVVHISEPMDRPSTENQLFHVQHMNARFRHEYRHLRLLWDEAGHTIEYALYFRNDSAGYWQILDGQNGTLPARPNYQQFSGTIQVLKAVNDHLVLNFCQEPIQGRSAQLYSVLFSREPGRMARWEIESVHSMLQNKKLSVASRRMVCGNSADRPLISFVLSSVMSVVILVLSSS
ncbi:uncharacterized protein LOC115445120 [Manduca sexta]|uniref:uncharacterized protein LOC115445120 n=1 Tax=Manduca sexta TaxID=7130 RepID=UPI0018901699|nr:uncharacterized protein LOC115445120 [Manduca sexta]XP_030027084.2 uncharacterized protein LOC115445120 [Manduca sexta]